MGIEYSSNRFWGRRDVCVHHTWMEIQPRNRTSDYLNTSSVRRHFLRGPRGTPTRPLPSITFRTRRFFPDVPMIGIRSTFELGLDTQSWIINSSGFTRKVRVRNRLRLLRFVWIFPAIWVGSSRSAGRAPRSRESGKPAGGFIAKNFLTWPEPELHLSQDHLTNWPSISFFAFIARAFPPAARSANLIRSRLNSGQKNMTAKTSLGVKGSSGKRSENSTFTKTYAYAMRAEISAILTNIQDKQKKYGALKKTTRKSIETNKS